MGQANDIFYHKKRNISGKGWEKSYSLSEGLLYFWTPCGKSEKIKFILRQYVLNESCWK